MLHEKDNSKKSEVESQKPEVVSQKLETKVKNSEKNYQIANENYVPYWQNVLDKIRQNGKMTIYANLIGTKGVQINDLIVGIEFPNKVTDFARKVIEEPENKSLIEKLVSMEQGSTMQIKIIDKSKPKSNTENKKEKIEDLATKNDLPFNVIDE